MPKHQSDFVDVRVSEGTREMARRPQLKFADLEQEKKWWTERKMEVQFKLRELRLQLSEGIANASAKARTGSDFFGMKSAIEISIKSERTALLREMDEIESNLAAVKLKIQQQNARVAITCFDTLKDGGPVTSSDLMRADGSVNFGPGIMLVIDLLREILATLKEIKENRSE